MDLSSDHSVNFTFRYSDYSHQKEYLYNTTILIGKLRLMVEFRLMAASEYLVG